MAGDVPIRAAGPGDVAAIAAIYAAAVRDGTGSFEIDPPDEAEMARRLEANTAGGFPWLVAERESAILGFAYAGAFRARAAFRATVEDSVYVADGAQRRGIGRKLLAELIGECRGRGFQQMLALVGDSDNAASIALHRAAGFTHAGTLRKVGQKHGRWLDVVVMQLDLQSGLLAAP